jgi:hypothetical protein
VFQGTRVEEAKVLLANSDFDLISIDDLDAAAGVAVTISKIRELAKSAGLDVKVRPSTEFAKWLDGHEILTGL